MHVTPYIIAIVIAGIITLLLLVLSKRLQGGVLPSVISGLVGLFAMQSSALWGNPLITANIFTTAVSAIMGIPGVISLLFLRILSAT